MVSVFIPTHSSSANLQILSPFLGDNFFNSAADTHSALWLILLPLGVRKAWLQKSLLQLNIMQNTWYGFNPLQSLKTFMTWRVVSALKHFYVLLENLYLILN